MKTKLLISAILASTLAIVGCESDSNGGSAGTGGNGGTGGGTGGSGGSTGGSGGSWVPIVDCADIEIPTAYSIANAPDTATDDCTTTLTATGTNDAAALNTAIELASSGDVICLAAGEYDMEGSVFVSDKQNLTIKGIGASVMDVKLDYEGRGDRGFDVTADGFEIENMWINDTAGNGVEIKADGGVFRKLFVNWDAGSVPANGAYSVYPTKCSNTLVEYVEVVGASDAGIYVGQCEGGLVRYNKIYSNVAGIEVENSLDVEVHDNEAFDNVAGILPLQEPNLDRLKNENILWHHNVSYCNNHENFARPGTTVSNIPPGIGAMIFGGDGIEMHSNIYDSNASTANLLVSNVILCQIAGDDCNSQPGYNPYPENIYIHDNQYFNNGYQAMGTLALISTVVDAWADGVSDVVWDGYINPDTTDPAICLGAPEQASYTDLTDDECQDAMDIDALGNCIDANNTQDASASDCVGATVTLP